MHRVLPVSKQPRMQAGKQLHAFASNGSKTILLQNIVYAKPKTNLSFFKCKKKQWNTCLSLSRRIAFLLVFLFALRYSGNRFHFKQQRLLNGADPICLCLSFLPEHPPKPYQQKPACLLGIFHIPCNDRHFSLVQRALRQIPPNRWV